MRERIYTISNNPADNSFTRANIRPVRVGHGNGHYPKNSRPSDKII